MLPVCGLSAQENEAPLKKAPQDRGCLGPPVTVEQSSFTPHAPDGFTLHSR